MQFDFFFQQNRCEQSHNLARTILCIGKVNLLFLNFHPHKICPYNLHGEHFVFQFAIQKFKDQDI